MLPFHWKDPKLASFPLVWQDFSILHQNAGPCGVPPWADDLSAQFRTIKRYAAYRVAGAHGQQSFVPRSWLLCVKGYKGFLVLRRAPPYGRSFCIEGLMLFSRPILFCLEKSLWNLRRSFWSHSQNSQSVETLPSIPASYKGMM